MKRGQSISSQIHGDDEDLHELEAMYLRRGGLIDILAARLEKMGSLYPAGCPLLASGPGPRFLRRGEGL